MKLHEFLRSYGPDLESVSPSEEAFNLSEKPDHAVLPTSSKELSGSPAGNSRPLSALVSSLENLIPRLNADPKRISGPVSRRKYLGSLSHLIKTAPVKEKRTKRPISLGSSEELFTAQVEIFEKEKIFDSTSSPCTPSFIEEKQAFDMLRQASLEWELISEEECTLRRENSNKPLRIENVGLQPPTSLLTSHILSEAQASKLFESLPLRAQGLELALKYSTEYHGFSLKTLYRRCEALLTEDATESQEEHSESPLTLQNQVFSSSCQNDQPCLLLIKDSTETRYLWSGENYFFLSGEQDSFIIGCTDGKSAIRIDGDVLRGRTQACGTFDNPELTEPGDFLIHTLEVWAFS
ncbi:unnamed protein product [Dibothriocephalus latus]|uniref:TLDc domain-containing protein n=1 Tax=Dibothriocephalus latus TaxID=60516 RepID=A0A3P6SAJ4_DIBLA|nr:unnamed protein product [Dibothriocephalus latus]